MNEFLISKTTELEKCIHGKVVEGEGSRVNERANIYFSRVASLEKDVMAGRLTTDDATYLRYISALCTASKVTKIVAKYNG